MSQANIVLPLTWADEAISSPCQPECAVIGHSLVALLYLQNASYSWKLCNNNQLLVELLIITVYSFFS